MNINEKKDKERNDTNSNDGSNNNNNQLVIEKLTDLLKISPDKLKKAQYSDFSGKYFNQIIEEVIKSEKNPKQNNNSINPNNNNKIINNNDDENNDDDDPTDENKNKILLINMENKNLNENYNINNNNYNYNDIYYKNSNTNFSMNNNNYFNSINNYASSYSIRKIIFIIYYNTIFGQEIAISGSNDKLGNWDKNKLFYLEWNKGNKWVGELDIEKFEDFEFKFVLCSNKKIISWEPGENNNVYFNDLFNEIKDYPKGKYNKYQYEYNRSNAELVLNCEW